VLQTSFHLLCKCQNSDIRGIAGNKAKAEVQPDELIEPVTNEDSDSLISAELTQTETASNVSQPELLFISNKNKNSNKASATNKKTAGEVGKNKPAAVISLAAISARVSRKNRQKPDIAVPADSTAIAPTTRT
jgi:hypothetical protein